MAIFLLTSVGRAFAWSLLILGATISTQAATLDVPGRRTHTLSGIGVIHGWKCTAGQLTVRFNGGSPLPLLYGAQRKDVQRAGGCARANVGFVSIMNWNELGDGRHTAVVYDDGVEFARETFTVVTPGMPFFTGGGECTVPDFPDFNQEAQFVWDVTTQHMELSKVSSMGEEDTDLSGVSDTDLTPLEFLLERPAWTIEVEGIDQWRTISVAMEDDWPVPAPARIEFMRRPLPGIKMPSDPAFRPAVEGAEIAGRIYGKRYGYDGLSTVIALGGVLDMLPEETAWQLNALHRTYALVIAIPGATQTYHTSHCYLLIFNLVQRTATGGLDTLAYFAVTEKENDTVTQEPGYRRLRPGACVPPVSPMYSTRLKIY